MTDAFTLRELSREWRVRESVILGWIRARVLPARRSRIGFVVGCLDRVRFERTEAFRARRIDPRAGMRPRHSGFSPDTSARSRRGGRR